MDKSLASEVAFDLPDSLPAVGSFLVDLNTPDWLWFFRILLAAGFLAAIIANRFWRRDREQ